MYKALQKQTGRIVAVKEIIITDEKMRKTAEVEAKTMGGCDCDFVINIYDYKIIGNVAYVLLISIFNV